MGSELRALFCHIRNMFCCQPTPVGNGMESVMESVDTIAFKRYHDHSAITALWSCPWKIIMSVIMQSNQSCWNSLHLTSGQTNAAHIMDLKLPNQPNGKDMVHSLKSQLL